MLGSHGSPSWLQHLHQTCHVDLQMLSAKWINGHHDDVHAGGGQ